MIDLNALAQPIFDLLESFGSGVLPTGGPSDALRSTSTAVDQIHQLGRDGINSMNTAWDGQAADAATAKALRVQTSAATISDRGNDMATVVNQAAAEVESGQKDLAGIAQSFVNTAASAGPALATPAGLTMIVGSAIDHLGQALNVVGRVQNELSTHTASMTDLTPAPPTTSLAGTPAVTTAGVQQLTSTATSALSGAGSMASSLMSTAMSAIPSTTSTSSKSTSGTPSSPSTPKIDTGSSGMPSDGKGVKITLPDGSTVEAPNEKAATAVRSAISAVGTPYVWGGNTPGAGLDCSGLTKYAYGEAGVDLPRLAADQATGTSVSPGDLMPGDLAIWDGHVAMVIGNGQFVEAGDPVQISSIRTENSGMGFHGFYRPTT